MTFGCFCVEIDVFFFWDFLGLRTAPGTLARSMLIRVCLFRRDADFAWCTRLTLHLVHTKLSYTTYEFFCSGDADFARRHKRRLLFVVVIFHDLVLLAVCCFFHGLVLLVVFFTHLVGWIWWRRRRQRRRGPLRSFGGGHTRREGWPLRCVH